MLPEQPGNAAAIEAPYSELPDNTDYRTGSDALAYFAHDAAGNRVMLQDGSGATYFAYDPTNRLTREEKM